MQYMTLQRRRDIMKRYVKPEASIIALDGKDIITDSKTDVVFDNPGRHAFLDKNLMDWDKDWRDEDDWTKGFKG